MVSISVPRSYLETRKFGRSRYLFPLVKKKLDYQAEIKILLKLNVVMHEISGVLPDLGDDEH